MPASEHVVPVRVYLVIYAVLMVLTSVTIAVAFLDLGSTNNVIMLTVAVTKATLVMLYFMHVRYSDRLTWVVVGTGFVWLAIMIGFTLSDYVARGILTGGVRS